MTTRLTFILTFIIVVAVFLYNALFVITEKQRAIKLRFGELEQANIPAGLHFRIPVMNKIIKMDGRILIADNPSQPYLTNEKKTLIVDSYIMWRIVDVRKFYVSTSGNEDVARRLISSRVDNGLRNKFGERTLNQVVSGERDELMISLKDDLNKITVDELGISVVDIRIKRIDLPDEVSNSVFARMRSEREQEARELRSTGREKAEEIRANADKERILITSEAQKRAEEIRGSGDAQAAYIYANAYQKSPKFFAFFRTLEAYKVGFQNKDDVMILQPDGAFFKYLK